MIMFCVLRHIWAHVTSRLLQSRPSGHVEKVMVSVMQSCRSVFSKGLGFGRPMPCLSLLGGPVCLYVSLWSLCLCVRSGTGPWFRRTSVSLCVSVCVCASVFRQCVSLCVCVSVCVCARRAITCVSDESELDVEASRAPCSLTHAVEATGYALPTEAKYVCLQVTRCRLRLYVCL